MRKGYFRKTVAILVCAVMVLTAMPSVWAAEISQNSYGSDSQLEEGSYAPGEVIVMFSDGAVDEEEMSLKSARKLSSVGSGFGMSLNASGSADEAAEDAKSEAAILEDSLGDDFVLEDSLVFPVVEKADDSTEKHAEDAAENHADEAADDHADDPTENQAEEAGDDSTESGKSGGFRLESEDQADGSGDLKIALVTSDRYDTETLIRKLEGNSRIAAAEPNYYIHYEDYDDYALDDTYASYLYQANSPLAENTAGDRVDDRGEMPENAEESVSTNAASGWKKLTGDENETVVAVVDSGINPEHEDLKDNLWVNDPEVTGLSGDHGYNFGNNDTDLTDHNGHGTHCAGIIAAAANNGKGVAGITGNANVKIMMLKTDGDDETRLYTAMGSYSYVLRAKAAGVNIVATSNSWGRDDTESTIFNEIIDRMGEAGILTFTAAGNATKDLDRSVDNPASNESIYGINVGCAGITGEPAGFSNYGKSQVDIFAPGVNILSTVGVTTYFPSLYTAEELARTTAYYGGFDKDVKINKKADGKNDSVIPSKGLGDDTVSAFGPSVFKVEQDDDSEDDEIEDEQEDESGEQDDESGEQQEEQGSSATCELEIVPEHYFTTGKNAASLKVTIKNAVIGESYYLYFPYKKDQLTEGCSNTKFSVYYESGDNADETECMVYGGEVVENNDGTVELTGYGMHGHTMDRVNKYVGSHLTSPEELGEMNDKILPYDELDGRKTGIGLLIEPSTDNNGSAWEGGEPHDVTFYLDSIAVSKANAEIDRNSSYEMMSGTSMACPAAAGAGALIAALYPREDGQSGAEYATMIKNKLMSCARKTDSLKDMCATGGFIDLTLLDDEDPAPVINDAVCSIKKKTITLYGSGLNKGIKLSYKRLLKAGSPAVELPADGMTVSYAADGKSCVIKNAKALFGTYTEFTAVHGEKSGQRSFFLVKGQNKIEMTASMLEPNPSEADYERKLQPERFIFTDADGKQLYAIEQHNGIISRFDGAQFVDIPGTDIKDSLSDLYLKNGYDKYQVVNDLSITVYIEGKAIVSGNRAYTVVSVDYTPGSESGGSAEPEEEEPDMQDEEDTDEQEEEPDDDENTIEKRFLASIDVTKKKPAWIFEEYQDPELEETDHAVFDYQAAGNKLYAVSCLKEEGYTALLSYDLSAPAEKRVWKREPDLPEAISSASLASYKGKLYMFFGAKVEEGKSGDELLSDDVWRFDGKKWERTGTLAFAGKYTSRYNEDPEYLKFPVEAANGLVFVECSVDGLGNTFLYDPEKDKGTPMYLTINDNNSDDTLYGVSSCAITRDGIYYKRDHSDEMRRGWGLYKIPASGGAYRSPYPKSANTIKVSASAKTVKYAAVRKKAVSVKAITVKKAKGKVTYKKAGVNKKKFAGKFTVNKKNGRITVKKGVKKGTYKITVKVRAAGDTNYKAATKTVKVTIRVK